jgi:hypothetical protein
MFTREKIEAAVKAKGYKYFDNGDFNVNIIGVRNSSTGSKVTNLFDDVITISYKENGVWKYFEWSCTTEPGKKGMLEGKAVGGVAFIVPGQYPGSHHIGLHQGKYEALTQKGNLKLYRDGDRDMEFDKIKITECSLCGVNIHMAGTDSTYVENWSEGCQVFKRAKDFAAFMAIVKKAAALHGNSFTYTLIQSQDIK